jgi:hypothetical protein
LAQSVLQPGPGISSHCSDPLFVLRPAGEIFELVSACYIHRILYGEGLSQDFGVNNQLYPGSTPEGKWAVSYPKVDSATRMTVAANGDVLRGDGFIRDRLTTAKSNGAAKKSRKRGV